MIMMNPCYDRLLFVHRLSRRKMPRFSPLAVALVLSGAVHALLLVLGQPSLPGLAPAPAWHVEALRAPRPGRPDRAAKPVPESRATASETSAIGAEKPLAATASHAMPAPETAAESLPSAAASAPAESPPLPSKEINSALPVEEAAVPVQYRIGSLSTPRPFYPVLSRQWGESGTVVLQVLVNEQGRAQEVVILRSSGYRRLDQSASYTIREKWRFDPARRGAAPVAEWVTVPLEFRLGEEAASTLGLRDPVTSIAD